MKTKKLLVTLLVFLFVYLIITLFNQLYAQTITYKTDRVEYLSGEFIKHQEHVVQMGDNKIIFDGVKYQVTEITISTESRRSGNLYRKIEYKTTNSNVVFQYLDGFKEGDDYIVFINKYSVYQYRVRR